MNIKNYTSDVPVSTTIGRIQTFLLECKVNGLTMEYDGFGGISALLFHIDLDRRYSVRMTANVDAVQDTFWHEYAGADRIAKTSDGDEHLPYNGRKRLRKSSFRQQAERTAWRLQQDWLEVQMSLLRLQKVDFLQVFLPYLWDGKTTFYHRLKEGGMLALPSSKTEGAA